MGEENRSAPGKEPVVRNSIKQLKERFVPKFKYGLLLSAAYNLAMLIIGCLNVHSCPVNKNIPLFLIAIGAIGLVSKITSYIRERLSKHVQVMYIESALYSVESIFFFLGTYWVYKEFKPSYTPGDQNYCDKTAYLFGFIYLTFYYALVIVMICGFCCFLACACCIGARAISSGADVEAGPASNEESALTNIKEINDKS